MSTVVITPFKLNSSVVVYKADNESDFRVVAQDFQTAHKQKLDDVTGVVVTDYPSENKKVVRFEQDKTLWNAERKVREVRTATVEISPEQYQSFLLAIKK